MERVQVDLPTTKEQAPDDELTLQQLVAPLLASSSDSITIDDVAVKLPDGSTITNLSQALLSKLDLSHGSLLTVVAVSSSKQKQPPSKASLSFAKQSKQQRSFDPFPSLAKDYETALRHAKRSSQRGGGSYASLAALHAALHTVEPQPHGKLFRVYMCQQQAARFQSNCIITTKRKNNGSSSSSSVVEPRCALLLGTVVRERKKPRASKTSLSSTTEEDQFGQAAKVHAVWEPPAQKSTEYMYDASGLLDGVPESVRRIADWLGLQPIGWIFSYDGAREPERTADDALPVLAPDVVTGARLQIQNMQRAVAAKDDKDDETKHGAARFVTLAMDATSGATEAFQLSDVAVQMVAEDVLVVDDSKRNKPSRHCPTRHPVLIDGKETTELDAVLCLVNTALLSHTGMYSSSSSAATTKKKTGALTSKARKSIAKALLGAPDDQLLLAAVCDFATLVALDDLLPLELSEQLCRAVVKYARGQKQSATVDAALQQRLKVLLALE